MLLQVITVRIGLPKAGSELSQRRVHVQYAGGFGFIVQQVGLATCE